MSGLRSLPRLDPSYKSPSNATRVSGKWPTVVNNILSTLGRKAQEKETWQQPESGSAAELSRYGVFEGGVSKIIQQVVITLSAMYACASFQPSHIKEHQELLQEAAKLREGFVAFHMEVSAEEDPTDETDASWSSAGGFSSLSSDGGSEVCKVEVSFASRARISQPDLVCGLKQAGFSVVSLTYLNDSPRGSLGQLLLRAYSDEFSRENLDKVFTSVLDQQRTPGPKWFPGRVRSYPGENATTGSFSEEKCDSGRWPERGSYARSSTCHMGVRAVSAGNLEEMMQVLGSGARETAKADICKFILDPLKVELGPVIALGASGEVRKGVYEGKEVAVKILKSVQCSKDRESLVTEFRREVVTLMACGECPHLLKLYGVFVDSRSRMCLVTKLMKGGTLLGYLQRRNGKKLPLEELLTIAKDIAAGMKFLHNNGITHRDLKSANVLLDGEGHSAVADFGVARLKGERGEMTKEVGTYRWMAPEAFGTSAWPLTHKSDVYSFGIVLWELVSLSLPFKSYSPVQAAVAVTLSGLRPTIPADCQPDLKVLIERCWEKNPDVRPEFSDVLDTLVTISTKNN